MVIRVLWNRVGSPTTRLTLHASRPIALRCQCTSTRQQQMVARALANLRAAADAGNSRALYDLGMLYHDGEVAEIPINKSKAVEYFQRAANQMYPMGMYMLGRYLEEGEYIDRDIPRAVSLIKHAANDGFYEAQKRLAYFYEHGIGVPKDINKALALHRLTQGLDRQHGATDNSENVDLGNVADILLDPTKEEVVEGATEDDELEIDTSVLDQESQDAAKMPWAGQNIYMPPSAQYIMMAREEWNDFVLSGGGSLVHDEHSADIVLLPDNDSDSQPSTGKIRMNETAFVDMAREAVREWLTSDIIPGGSHTSPIV